MSKDLWVILPHEDDENPKKGHLTRLVLIDAEDSLSDLQEIVGGLIEYLPNKDGLTLVANEEGWMRGLPHNERLRGIFGQTWIESNMLLPPSGRVHGNVAIKIDDALKTHRVIPTNQQLTMDQIVMIHLNSMRHECLREVMDKLRQDAGDSVDEDSDFFGKIESHISSLDTGDLFPLLEEGGYMHTKIQSENEAFDALSDAYFSALRNQTKVRGVE